MWLETTLDRELNLPIVYKGTGFTYCSQGGPDLPNVYKGDRIYLLFTRGTGFTYCSQGGPDLSNVYKGDWIYLLFKRTILLNKRFYLTNAFMIDK